MRTRLENHEVASYRKNGFAVIDQFLTQEELEHWRTAIGDAVRSYRAAQARPAPDDEFYKTIYHQKVDEQILQQLINLWRMSPAVKELVLDEALGRMACDLEGIDGVRLLTDQALIKPPYASATSYHLDNPHASFTSPHHFNLWVALDDATVDNGCLFYLPGTHRHLEVETAKLGPEIGAIFEMYPSWRDIAPVACPVRAGGCVLHNGMVAHGASANMTNRPRRAMVAIYMPVGATFNGRQNILSDRQMAALRVGDRLEDDLQNPPVFSRTP